MYTPPHFAEARPEELARIISGHPLGTLVTHSAHGLDANHLPFEFEFESPTLRAHIARANTLWKDVADGAEVLVIFHGAQGYVSPNWYPSKHEAHRQVPTWNYEVVHAHGRIRFIDDEKFLRGLLARLTRHHEATEPRPWKMGDAPPDYIERMLQAVVGLEIEVTRLEGKRKLSQNREPRDVAGAIAALDERGVADLAQAMRRDAP
jgi:transcriptional regulator